MEYRHLGRTGLKVSLLSYGAWGSFKNQMDVAEAKSLLSVCRDAGVNFFDNAEFYMGGKAEEIMRDAIRELGWTRSDLVISTKLFLGPGNGVNHIGLSRKHIVEGIKGSLKRLDMEYVDLLYAHRPDPSTPIEETVRAMNWAIDHGYAFYWGTSEWTAQQITAAWAAAERLDLIGPAMEQPQYNLLHREKVEDDYLALYDQYGLGLTTWSPLRYGVLSGKYSKDNVPQDSRLAKTDSKRIALLAEANLNEKVLAKVDGLKPIAQELRVSLSQLAIGWCAKNPNVSSVIIGATSTSQLEENLKALEVLPKLTTDVLEKIEAIIQTKPVIQPRRR